MTTRTLNNRLYEDDGQIQVYDDAHSFRGKSLVTMSVGFEDHLLTPDEAFHLAEMLWLAASSAGMKSKPKRIVDKPVWQGYED